MDKEDINTYVDNIIDKINESTEETSAAAGLPGFDMPHTNVKNRKKQILQDESEENPSGKDKRLMIDFDGVIHSYHKGWQNGEIYGYPLENAKETIDELSNEYEIVIFTTRASDIQENKEIQIKSVENWLMNNQIYFDSITADKLPADLYIDDKAIRFENNWNEIKTFINGLEQEK